MLGGPAAAHRAAGPSSPTSPLTCGTNCSRPKSNVLSVKIKDIKGPGAGIPYYTILYHLSSSPVVKEVSSKPSIKINQPMGIWDIYGLQIILQQPIQ
jgi:hypothetical protein